MGSWAQKTLYENVTRAMQGGGLTPSGFGGLRRAYRSAYQKLKPEMESYLHRLVPRTDTRVRGFARQQLSRGFNRTMQDLREQEKLKPFEERQEAIAMGTDLLAGEKRISASITQMFNQQQQENLMREMQYGTYGSNLAYGLGQAGGWALDQSAAQRYAQGMSGQPAQTNSAAYFQNLIWGQGGVQ